MGRYFDCVASAARNAPGSLVGRSGGAARDDGKNNTLGEIRLFALIRRQSRHLPRIREGLKVRLC